jgi:hypothetical protein
MIIANSRIHIVMFGFAYVFYALHVYGVKKQSSGSARVYPRNKLHESAGTPVVFLR